MSEQNDSFLSAPIHNFPEFQVARSGDCNTSNFSKTRSWYAHDFILDIIDCKFLGRFQS